MDVSKLVLGDNAPKEFNVVIEIQSGVAPVKYEIDKDSGVLVVDRFVATPMFYPCNYGFLPQTLGSDGDPLDALILTEVPVIPGSLIKVRPIGVLLMKDESGEDEKIICVPVSKVTSFYDNIKTYQDLPNIKLEQIKHFFERYKDLEKGKWVEVLGFADIAKAESLIKTAIANNKD
ncbi:inorganic diphosphatase [Rickettsiales bacterium LUAb2]